ncbi:zygote arrest protein 1 [Lampris incognitus]|uniref:zygote arrest protein 1 n=1 Tax=Lampris incognitus TaxID=2546036 RepID=UPI0024B4CD4A|nr:zygote arrest protein 1 [Lampris incognitus]
MATYRDESIDSYLYSSYNPYTGRYHRPKDSGRKFGSHLSSYADADAYNNQQRAKLKSILSQINPKLTPRLRKANTRDVAVQVNPRIEASVQCALGPRTLVNVKRGPKAPPVGSPKEGDVRYTRNLAVYSPMTYRSVTSFIFEESKAVGSSAQTGEPPGPARESGATKEAKAEAEDAAKKPAAQRKNLKAKRPVNAGDAQSAQEGSKAKNRVKFQFLEQKYGYFHCRECNLRWESAYVWCVQGTNKVYFKQFCRKCQADMNPFRVEDITCQNCNKARCSCAVSPRHVDPTRPHRQDLCGRCKSKRLSCDSTFSFKYII